MPAELLKNVALASQLVFVLAGLVLLWRHVFGPAARASTPAPKLAPWPATIQDIAFFFFHGVFGAFLGSFLVGLFAKPLGLHGDQLSIVATAALHLGILCGLALCLRSQPGAAPAFGRGVSVVLSGLATFLIALPFVSLTNLAWLQFLKLVGYDIERQPAVELVSRLGTTPWMTIFVFFAVIVAPCAEELLFRAGLFRYLRTRQSKGIALVVPSLLFAAIHFHLPSYLPLAVLGIIFSLAYERTGTLGTAIIAHSAFNLNNLLVLLSGAGK